MVVFCVFAGVILLVGCSANKSVMVNPDIVGLDYSQRTLAVYPTHSSEVTVNNPNDVRDDYHEDTREPEEVVADLLNQHGYAILEEKLCNVSLQDKTESEIFSPSLHQKKFMSIYLEVTNKKSKTETIEFVFPKVETLRSAGLTDDVVLYINHFETGVGHHIKIVLPDQVGGLPGQAGGLPGQAGGLTGQEISSTKTLTGEAKFIIWDYSRNKPISWGISESTVDVTMGIVCTQATWETMIKNVVKGTCEETNFHK